VDSQKSVSIVFYTNSQDIYTSPQAYDRTFNGDQDFFVAKISPNGSNIDFATYLGGSGTEYINTHNLALDDEGNIYVSPWTSSADFPTTSHAFQRQMGGGSGDIAVTKFSPAGDLLASTYIGGSGPDNSDGVYSDRYGNVFLSGNVDSKNFPVTADAYQKLKIGGMDAVLFILSSDLSQLEYSTYIGGKSDDAGRSCCLDKDGNLYVTGQTSGSGWPTKSAYQSEFQGGQLDVIMAKFRKTSLRLNSQ
jgi:hypothetical protein